MQGLQEKLLLQQQQEEGEGIIYDELSQERVQFLAELDRQKKEHDRQLRREQDKMEEYYAKRTRELALSNLGMGIW